eukprot:CAMPEP_0170516064 /NCGR_PEP_ID=MMETSP0209-20121228/2404_1 /TAXON_ID=665100 ORGANISM="Litonotus pictus, Strain P1" /NCGR_SAMPLE_ID=MMETSP0209 /ASSEMBLY_ACC=CAM_ASM_000301 /LENGTH=351 /DNA_ID=CAMNT_0010800835 /DNA_START=205 /DNA_END=1260 /DNA_ORIENTATION=+
MTLFHYYTYFKSFKHFDKFKLITSCLFLSGKIKGLFIKLDILQNFYKKYSQRNNEITDKEIMGFELDLLIFLGFEVDIETSFYYLDRYLRKINISKLVLANKISTESTNDGTEVNYNTEMGHINNSNSNNHNLSHNSNSNGESNNEPKPQFSPNETVLSEETKENEGNGILSSHKPNQFAHPNNRNNLNNPCTSEGDLLSLINNSSSANNIYSGQANQGNQGNQGNQAILQQRVTKVIDSNSARHTTGTGNSLVQNLGMEYLHSLSQEEISDKIKSVSFNLLCDSYRRSFCIAFRPKCIALCSFLLAFNLLVDSNNSDYYLDLKYFFSTYYEEGDYKDFLVCYSEMQKLFN